MIFQREFFLNFFYFLFLFFSTLYIFVCFLEMGASSFLTLRDGEHLLGNNLIASVHSTTLTRARSKFSFSFFGINEGGGIGRNRGRGGGGALFTVAEGRWLRQRRRWRKRRWRRPAYRAEGHGGSKGGNRGRREKKKQRMKEKKEKKKNKTILISLLKIRFESVKLKIMVYFYKIAKLVYFLYKLAKNESGVVKNCGKR